MMQAHGAEDGKILTDRRRLELPRVADLVKKAAARADVGPGRIFREILALAFRRGGITQREYFGYHLYRSDISPAEKRQFIGEKENYRLNLRLSPPQLTRMRGFLGDKVTLTALWRQFGLPTTTTQAMFTPDRWLGTIPTLRDAAAVEAFLTHEARYPLFGKPAEGLQALGSARIESVDAAAGTATLGNGQSVALRALAEEIVRDYPDGYLFQDSVVQHPGITEIFGPALSCMRFVTVIDDMAPEVFYTYWKIAATDGMSDNFWQPGALLARVNARTGVIERCITGKGPETEEVNRHPVTGHQVLGYRLPFWQEATDLVLKAHAIYPINGCLGWDVAFTADGPVLIECNDNTGHATYQMVVDRGFRAPEFADVLDRVEARSKRLIEERKARVYSFRH